MGRVGGRTQGPRRAGVWCLETFFLRGFFLGEQERMRSIWSCRTTERGRGSAIRPPQSLRKLGTPPRHGHTALCPESASLCAGHRPSKMGVACLSLFSLLSAGLGRRSDPNSSPRGFFYLEPFKGMAFSDRF